MLEAFVQQPGGGRNQAVRVRKQGYTYKAIGEWVGVHESTVIDWVKRYVAQDTRP